MYVVTRKIGQGVMIGDAIEVVILEVREEKVRLGVRVPRDISVHRKEIYQQIHEIELPVDSQGEPDQGPTTQES